MELKDPSNPPTLTIDETEYKLTVENGKIVRDTTAESVKENIIKELDSKFEISEKLNALIDDKLLLSKTDTKGFLEFFPNFTDNVHNYKKVVDELIAYIEDKKLLDPPNKDQYKDILPGKISVISKSLETSISKINGIKSKIKYLINKNSVVSSLFNNNKQKLSQMDSALDGQLKEIQKTKEKIDALIATLPSNTVTTGGKSRKYKRYSRKSQKKRKSTTYRLRR